MAIDYSKDSLRLSPCLEVSWSDQVRRLVRANDSVTCDGEVYQSAPALEFSEVEYRGGTEPEQVDFSCGSGISPFREMSQGTHAPVTVRIGELDLSDLSEPPNWLVSGEVSQTTLNSKGRAGTVQVVIRTTKSRLKGLSLGIKATDRCPLFFGSETCGAVPGTVSAVVSSVSGSQLILSSLPNDTTKGGWAAGRYHRGRVERNGVRLLIRKHHVGLSKLTLANLIPPDWVGQSVTVIEGCDKTISACSAHGRQSRFLGIGGAMPDYNPIIESPE
jgi:hypothetical protein